jgi:hypothetical protein
VGFYARNSVRGGKWFGVEIKLNLKEVNKN